MAFFCLQNSITAFNKKRKEIQLNTALKIKIIKSEKTQVEIAKKVGLSEERLSQFVCERRKPHPEEKGRIARVLKCKIQDIFPS